MAKKKTKSNARLIRRPGYQYTLNDLQEMVYQLGGRLQVAIYPKEFDERAKSPEPPVADTQEGDKDKPCP